MLTLPMLTLPGAPMQLLVVLCLVSSALAYAILRGSHLTGTTAANVAPPPKAYAIIVFIVELMGMLTLLFYAAHTTCKPDPFMPSGSEVGPALTRQLLATQKLLLKSAGIALPAQG